MPNASPRKRVLVVDDEKLIADTLAQILRISGYDAARVYSAEEALRWCGDNCPDVVISDVVMGGMNGIQLAIRVAESIPDCKVILISGHALTPTLIEDSMPSGHKFAILAKPVHPREILDLLACT